MEEFLRNYGWQILFLILVLSTILYLGVYYIRLVFRGKETSSDSEKKTPKKSKNRVITIAVTVAIAELLSWFSIYKWEEYGIVLFVLIPLLIMGVFPVIVVGRKEELTFKKAMELGLIILGYYIAILFVFALEGAICIIMYLPIAVGLVILGNYLGYLLVKKRKNNNVTLCLIFFSLPITGYIEKGKEFTQNVVSTQIEIHADEQTVWQYLVTFPKFDKPTELILKTGIAYPLNGQIKDTPNGKIIDCEFTTGRFVGEINEWKENKLIQFTVKEQPQSMKELSLWDIEPPHVNAYFNCEKGLFKLTKLPNGNVLLEGKTWYRHQIRPNAYWKFWSNYVMDKVHSRVLTYVKENAEKQNGGR